MASIFAAATKLEISEDVEPDQLAKLHHEGH
jgi:hypothetical protein